MNRFFSYLDTEWQEQFSSGLLLLCYNSTVTVHAPIIAVDRPDMPDAIFLSICKLRQSSNSGSRMQVVLSVSRCSQIGTVAEGGSISSAGGMLTDLHMVRHMLYGIFTS
jgi:hypothetical protein